MLLEKSNVSEESINALCETIQSVYLSDDRPWIIGYSGGKDSTTVLQLVWRALAGIDKERLHKKVYCISSDTFVEMPIIAGYLSRKIKEINSAAAIQGFPLEASLVTPDLDETFWVNLLGRGYPAPYRNFRWCTDRMKIKPTSRFIKSKINEHGEVVVVLGVRRAESSARAASMQEERVTESGKKVGRKVTSKYLSEHKDLPSALVFSPIEDWTTEEVWSFLDSGPAPWGGDHSEIRALYENAQKPNDDGEDDLAEKTFGNSRFGCWTCSVVQRDLSMEAMVNKVEHAWMRPLLEYRNWLTATQDPEKKAEIRHHRRRSGSVQTWKDKEGKENIIWGPFLFEFRQLALRRLLEAQVAARELKGDPGLELITYDELLRIRQYWRLEEGDWGDSLPKIYQDVCGVGLVVPVDDWSGMGEAEFKILKEVCDDNGLQIGLLTELFAMELRYHGMSRRSKVYSNVHSILRKDWRTRDEVFAEIEMQNVEEESSFESMTHVA